MTPVIQVEHLTRRYRGHTALDDVSFTVQENSITGLLGRNGAGKTTLMRILTGQEFKTSGSVRVFGEYPLENNAILRRMVFIKESQIYPELKFKRVIEAASWFHPHWDQTLADELIDAFALPMDRKVKKFSRGMMSAVGIVVGIASRAEVTFFDEPYLGLDATSRQVFYDKLLADYAEHPRTIVLSTHLIDEVANLLENVLVIDSGRVVLDASVDELRGKAVTVSGGAPKVAEFIAGKQVWHRDEIGSRATATVAGPIDELERRRARDLGIELDPITLQQLVVRSSGIGENSQANEISPASAERASA